MSERYYKATPCFDGADSVTAEGLAKILEEVYRLWGGKLRLPEHVRPSLSLGAGAAIVATEAGRVLIERDDVTTDIARKQKHASVEFVDGRLRKFSADMRIMRASGKNIYEDVSQRSVVGTGLKDLFYRAALFVLEELGDVPDCLFAENSLSRVPSTRAQIAKARAEGRSTVTIVFPKTRDASSFSVPSRPNERYVVTVTIDTEFTEHARIFRSAAPGAGE